MCVTCVSVYTNGSFAGSVSFVDTVYIHIGWYSVVCMHVCVCVLCVYIIHVCIYSTVLLGRVDT